MCDSIAWDVTAVWYGDSQSWAGVVREVTGERSYAFASVPQEVDSGSLLEAALELVLDGLGAFLPHRQLRFPTERSDAKRADVVIPDVTNVEDEALS
jgi:hypothetical protein